MERTFHSKAKSDRIIEVFVSKEFCFDTLKSFDLYIDGKRKQTLTPISISESHSSRIYTLTTKEGKFIPGKRYELRTMHNYFIPIDISYLASTPEFEAQYRYDGQLGAIYTPKKTTFRVFSPFATRIILVLKRKGARQEECHLMKRDPEKGIFSVTIEGDLDESMYVYEAEIFSTIYKVVDPYAFSVDSNTRNGFVINPQRVKAIDTNNRLLPKINDITESIIYECSIRDMTSLTKEEGRGTYDLFYKEGLTSSNGEPIGIDYIQSLGVNYIQLMPVLDFQTVDDDNPKAGYNWGYDPMSYFALEGSYAKNPNDPYDRVLSFRKLVSKYHQRGIRITLDVVYNHLYSTKFNSLSILVPQYYFRHNPDGTLSNGSGCGNDIESRNFMARKLIIDSMVHLVDFYDIDGFRFDLMGILDVETINLAKEKTLRKKKDLIFYGEGWDLWTNLPFDQKASLYNSGKLEGVGFFNDRYRDVAKGKSSESEVYVKGYLLGDTNYIDGFKHVMLGSATTLAFAPMLSSYKQSVNYVECHDNFTLFDKLTLACSDETEIERLKRIKLLHIATLFACGIPFFYEGQEIGHSKKLCPNSYNAGDDINGFDYKLLSERKDLLRFFTDAVMLKKQFIALAKDYYSNLPSHITFENLPQGALKINYDLPEHKLYVIFNPTKSSVLYDFNDYTTLVFNDTGLIQDSNFYIRLGIINALSVNVFLQKKNTGRVLKEENA